MSKKQHQAKHDPAVPRQAADRTAFSQPAMLPIHAAPWWVWWSIALIVAAATVATYWPTLHNEFVSWDDKDYLERNEYLTKPGGLKKIWNPKAKQNQYYPLVFTSFWIEHQIEWAQQAKKEGRQASAIPPGKQKWNPAIYHGTNLALHAINAALLVWLLRLLGLGPWVVWLVAGLFALHPINVASVAWAAERKNVLSGLFYILALIFYVRSTRRSANDGWVQYAVCLVFFVLALLSKTAMATLPATAILCDRLILRRWTWRSFVLTTPMFALGLAGILQTRLVEKNNAKGKNVAVLEPIKRPLAAAGAVWFYVYKTVVPQNFIPVYPRWEVTGGPRNLAVFLTALFSLPLIGYGIWRIRRKIPDHVHWGLAHYLLTLGPMLGLVAFNYMQFSFVADHFVYLASLGLFVAIAVGLWQICRRLGEQPKRYLPVTLVACAILAALGTISRGYVKNVWHDSEQFWTFNTQQNPDCWPGHYNLANVYRSQGNQAKGDERRRKLAEAIECYKRAAVAKPGLFQAHREAAEVYQELGDMDGAADQWGEVVRIQPRKTDFRMQFGSALTRAGREEEAEREFRELIRLDPNDAMAHVRLAECLRRRMRWDEALDEYRIALDLNPNLAAAKLGMQSTERARAQLIDGS